MTTELVKVGLSELVRDPGEECLATFWRQVTLGTSYVRCELPARHLPGQMLNLGIEDLYEEEGFEPIMPRARGVQVWQFPGEWGRGSMMAHQQELGYRVLVEVDDNYLLPVPDGMNLQWARTIGRNPGGYSNEAHRRIVGFADGVIVSTEALAKAYRKVSKNVYLCPNGVDPFDWDQPRQDEDDVLRIVYAGSPSHQRDAGLVARALEWATKQDGVEVWCLGFRPAAWRFPVNVIPWTDSLDEYRSSLCQFDIGVAPLVENPWSVGKSDLKVLEYAMAGALPIASRAEPYRPWFDSAVPIASSAKEFFHHVKRLVADRDETKRLASEVRAQVLGTRTIQSVVDRWREAIEGDPQ